MLLVSACIFWWSRVVKNNFSWWHEPMSISLSDIHPSKCFWKVFFEEKVLKMEFLSLDECCFLHSKFLFSLFFQFRYALHIYFAISCQLLLLLYCHLYWLFLNEVEVGPYMWNFVLKQVSSLLSTE